MHDSLLRRLSHARAGLPFGSGDLLTQCQDGECPAPPETSSHAPKLAAAYLAAMPDTPCITSHLSPITLNLTLTDGTVCAGLCDAGDLLVALADVAMPGVAPPLAGASAAAKLAAFTTASRQLGVPEDEVLPPEGWQPGPQRSAEAVAAALTAWAREAAARSLLPPLAGA